MLSRSIVSLVQHPELDGVFHLAQLADDLLLVLLVDVGNHVADVLVKFSNTIVLAD